MNKQILCILLSMAPMTVFAGDIINEPAILVATCYPLSSQTVDLKVNIKKMGFNQSTYSIQVVSSDGIGNDALLGSGASSARPQLVNGRTQGFFVQSGEFTNSGALQSYMLPFTDQNALGTITLEQQEIAVSCTAL